jgi:hypothetical protein
VLTHVFQSGVGTVAHTSLERNQLNARFPARQGLLTQGREVRSERSHVDDDEDA